MFVLINPVDILMLYKESYQETISATPQTFPPTIPIEQLFHENGYPVGQELSYSVSLYCVLLLPTMVTHHLYKLCLLSILSFAKVLV